MNVRVRPEANAEVSEALTWLVKRERFRVVTALWNAWQTAQDAIAATPKQFPPADDGPDGFEVRNYLIRRFGYRAIYVVTATECVIVSFRRGRRGSTQWHSRVTDGQ